MVSSGKGDIGIGKLTTEVLHLVEQLPKMVEGITGVDISKVSKLVWMLSVYVK